MTTVIMLQKRIVKALEEGKDTTPILKELAELRAKQAMDGELEELAKVANQKQALRDTAKRIKEKVEKQNKAIDGLLEARDTVIKQLVPLLEPMSELVKMGASSWEREPGGCYLYNDLGVFASDARSVPADYLPKDFGCPFLQMSDGMTDARGKVSEAYQYLSSAIGILQSFTKGIQRTASAKSTDPLLENVDVAGGCSICSHPALTEIDKALKDNVSLRALETKYKVSRSSLSRHKNNCLNIGAVKVVD